MDLKVGISICSGCGIGERVNIPALEKLATQELKTPPCLVHSQLCGDEAVRMLGETVIAQGFNRICVAACSGRYFTERFRFGPQVVVDRLALRELVGWTQPESTDREEVQALASDYLRMSLARLTNSEPPEPKTEKISERVLVVGGGVAGLAAAQACADAGYEVLLVEKESTLGGWARRYRLVTPSLAPYRELEPSPAPKMAETLLSNPKVQVLTAASVKSISGQPGLFQVTVTGGSGDETYIVGAIVQATGWRPYDAAKLGKLGFGVSPDVVTSVQFEDMAASGRLARPSNGQPPKSVGIVHCAGSRDPEHLPYCSAACCGAALKHALYVRQLCPNATVYLFYKDVRTAGLEERFYERVQEEPGVTLVKGEVVEVAGNPQAGCRVRLEQTLIGEPLTLEVDLLVLETGMVPTTLVEDDAITDPAVPPTELKAESEPGSNGKKAGASAERGARILNLTYRLGTDLPTLKYGFPDSHFICFPYETRRTGIYAAGAVRAPMSIPSAIKDGYGAALKAMQCITAVSQGRAVHPRSGDLSVPEFFLQRCTQCKRCTEECPFGTLDEDTKGTPLPNLFRCRRCGICMGACPERIISFKDYSPAMISQMIKAIEVPGEEEEKPRIIAFVCENDAVPALEIAAERRAALDPAVRFITVRCIGSVNTVFIADALSGGFDGILLLGCKRGDDYQCHFIRGSELANRRMENVQEKLKQLVLEPERVRIEEVQLSDWVNLPKLVNDFAAEIRALPLNPYKGF